MISACKIIFSSFSATCRINIFLFFFFPFFISLFLCQSIEITGCNAIYDIIGANNRKFPVFTSKRLLRFSGRETARRGKMNFTATLLRAKSTLGT